ncbi:MAG: DUF3810 domain-containing protein [Flavobacteriaceae bacterium]|nr:DUF3810 domain-containing protein [Bacteroidia bacterium]MBT8287020.1 DUF3810 domain-containing protein [Bacteroidia bacterium]NNF75799.1 DUF3810 domain-containing protein [Flavobacteriaceae bacterium]NNK71583.1 DUF3810 domain-containing protein [Flavobacteriaceae bacterium]
MSERTKTILAWSIIPQILIVKGLSFFPGFIESVYSNGFYLLVSKVMRYTFGWLPFSFGDIIYTLAGVYIIRWVVKNAWRIRKYPKQLLRDVMMAISLVYFSFHLLWGFNYYRKPLHEVLDLETDYSTEQLLEVLDTLTIYTNAFHNNLAGSDTIKISMPYSKVELLNKSTKGYGELQQMYPHLNPAPPSVKRSLYSLPLTYMGFSGYLNPFTHEAQIDGLIPLHKYPVTACHEQAHQIGYAAENEANFIGYLAAVHNQDLYFQYSANIFAIKHCLFELARRDQELFEIKRDALNLGILKNYEEERLFWMGYQNPLEPIFKETFNTFLKANSQTDGIKSYSYVVALLVNYIKKEGVPKR